MKRFCFWQTKTNSSINNSFTCCGKLFHGHIGNCPYKNLGIALLKCSEVEPIVKKKKNNKNPVLYRPLVSDNLFDGSSFDSFVSDMATNPYDNNSLEDISTGEKK